jgi:hypothetical protein
MMACGSGAPEKKSEIRPSSPEETRRGITSLEMPQPFQYARQDVRTSSMFFWASAGSDEKRDSVAEPATPVMSSRTSMDTNFSILLMIFSFH